MAATSRRELSREELELRLFKAEEIAENLAALKDTDGWKTLVEVFEAYRQSYYSTLTRSLMRGNEVNQRKLDYNRGLFDGVDKLLSQPDTAQSVLEKATKSLAEAADKE